MIPFRKSGALAAVAIAGVLATATASATPITYDFTVTATSGPLAGTVSHGSFSYDSSVPTGTNSATGLLTALHFTWNGTTYSAQTANTGALGVSFTGQLQNFIFGNYCPNPGACEVVGDNNEWDASWSFLGFNQFQYSVPSINAVYYGDLTISQATAAVPEPSALALFGGGLLLLGAFVGLRRRYAA